MRGACAGAASDGSVECTHTTPLFCATGSCCLKKGGKIEGSELTGVEEGEDGTSNEKGDRIDGEEELAPPDWRVRAGHRDGL